MMERAEMVREVTSYLQKRFPDAKVNSRQDALTKNEVFTINDAGTARHVEVTERWFDRDEGEISLLSAVNQWGLADAVRILPPSGTLRVAPTGIEPVS